MFDPFMSEKQILRKLGGDKNHYSFTFDGNTEGKVTIPLMAGVSFVKVSNKVLTKEELLGATYVSFDGKNLVVAEKNIIDNSAMGVTTQFFGVMADNMTDAPVIVSCKACTINFNGVPITVPSDGTYFIYMIMGSPMFVSELSNETIVPIDQKYLPGVCLPVVELSTAFSPGTVIDGDDQKKLWDAYKNGVPTVIMCDISIGNTSYQNARMVWSVAKAMGDAAMHVFVASVGGTMLMIYSLADGGGTECAWNCAVQ